MTPDNESDQPRNVFGESIEAQNAAIARLTNMMLTLGQEVADGARTGNLPAVPNKPKTPLQSFRCEVELWKAAQVKARAEGTNLGAVLRAYLKRYVARSK